MVKDLDSDDNASDGGGAEGGGEVEEWDDAGATTGLGGKLSKKEQYRIAVEQAREQRARLPARGSCVRAGGEGNQARSTG